MDKDDDDDDEVIIIRILYMRLDLPKPGTIPSTNQNQLSLIYFCENPILYLH